MTALFKIGDTVRHRLGGWIGVVKKSYDYVVHVKWDDAIDVGFSRPSELCHMDIYDIIDDDTNRK